MKWIITNITFIIAYVILYVCRMFGRAVQAIIDGVIKATTRLGWDPEDVKDFIIGGGGVDIG